MKANTGNELIPWHQGSVQEQCASIPCKKTNNDNIVNDFFLQIS